MNSYFRSKLNDRLVPHWCPTERHLTPGGYSYPYNLYGEAPPESGTFLRLQVYVRVEILKRPKRDNNVRFL